jgi:pyruvate formate lyase activating enzyme
MVYGLGLGLGLLFDIDRFSTHDGPGIRAAVFLKGCPLSCKWCHSPESQRNEPELIYQQARCTGCGSCVKLCPENAITFVNENGNFQQKQFSTEPENGTSITDGISINRKRCKVCLNCVSICVNNALRVCGYRQSAVELFEILKQDKLFYINSNGGVTVTGGEPLMQPEFTYELLTLCRENGINTAIETCGYGNRTALLKIAELCDLIFYDIKLLDESEHRNYTGVSNALILENFAALCEASDCTEKITVRIPCIPFINDSPEHIAEITRFALQHGVSRVELMPYNPSAGAKYEWLGQRYELNASEPRTSEYYNMLNETVKQITKT